MTSSRLFQARKNATLAILFQSILLIVGFVSRSIFVHTLGSQYLGLNGLFTQILQILSLADLGIGQALVFSMYEPIAKNNKEKLATLLNLYKKIYLIIGFSVFLLGLMIIPFLSIIINGVEVNESISILFVLFLVNSVVSYFYTYCRSILIADQKNFIVQFWDTCGKVILNLLQIFLLLKFRNYTAYLVIQIFFTIITNIIISYISKRNYKDIFMINPKTLPDDEKRNIIANIKGLIIYKIGGTILGSTDNIIISMILNTVMVGYYSNYLMITTALGTITMQAYNSIFSTIGNLHVTATTAKKENVFYELMFISAWVFGFLATGLFLFLNPVVSLWLGNKYELSNGTVFAISFLFFFQNMHYPANSYRQTAGLFIHGKYAPLIASIINIFFSILLGKVLGLPGILFGTVIALFVYEIVDPKNIYKYIFKKSVGNYYLKYCKFLIPTIVSAVGTFIIMTSINLYGGYIELFSKIMITTFLYNLIFILFSCKQSEFKKLTNRFKTLRGK